MHLLKMTGNVDNYDLLRQSVAAEIKELPEIEKALINWDNFELFWIASFQNTIKVQRIMLHIFF